MSELRSASAKTLGRSNRFSAFSWAGPVWPTNRLFSCLSPLPSFVPSAQARLALPPLVHSNQHTDVPDLHLAILNLKLSHHLALRFVDLPPIQPCPFTAGNSCTYPLRSGKLEPFLARAATLLHKRQPRLFHISTARNLAVPHLIVRHQPPRSVSNRSCKLQAKTSIRLRLHLRWPH